MKKLLKISIVISLIFSMSCSEDLLHDQNLPDDVNIDLSLSKKAPVYDGIDFAVDGFTSLLFYSNITGPDGIHVLNKNKLLVTKEYKSEEEPDGIEGVYLAKRGWQFSLSDAFSSIGLPFISPDDIVADETGTLYVADGQAQTVFKIDKHGGTPIPFVTTSTTGSDTFNPFGVAITPIGFDGPNVDPGDLIVCDNAYGSFGQTNPTWAVWAVNRSTGTAKIIAQGNAFTNGPINAGFNSEGTLFISLNTAGTEFNKIVTLDPYGNVADFIDELSAPFFAIHPLTDDIYCKKHISEIHVIHKGSIVSSLFASNLGNTRPSTQDMVFNKQGTSLYISSRFVSGILEIYNKKGNW